MSKEQDNVEGWEEKFAKLPVYGIGGEEGEVFIKRNDAFHLFSQERAKVVGEVEKIPNRLFVQTKGGREYEDIFISAYKQTLAHHQDYKMSEKEAISLGARIVSQLKRKTRKEILSLLNNLKRDE